MPTKIEWTDETWNPVRGCERVSEGCRRCYAEILAARHSYPGGWGEGLATWVTRPDGSREARWSGVLRPMEQLLDAPLKWQRPRRIFVNSMSDLFHEDVPNEFIQKVWLRMAMCPQHTFQILTKRPRRMLEWLSSHDIDGGMDSVRWGETEEVRELERKFPWPLPNVWLGVSVEDQAAADERIPLLLQTPAAVRWISAEPLLGPVQLGVQGADGFELFDHGMGEKRPPLDWVVAGGESGPGAREMRKEWARSLRDQCAAAGVAFFFKQWGVWAPDPTTSHPHRRVGKKRAGRELDGRTHDEYPV